MTQRISMEISEEGLVRINMVMKEFGFKDQQHFLRYCLLNTILPILEGDEHQQAAREIQSLKNAQE